MRKDIIYSLVTGTIILVGFLIFGGYAIVEPLEVTAQAATSSNLTVNLTVTEEISLAAPSTINMSPNITMSASSSIGTGDSWLVKTNSQDGWKLELESTTTPALVAGGESFADATTTLSTWSVGADEYIFGFSIFGDYSATTTWGTGSNCGSAGTPSATLNYRGFAGSAKINVATDSSETGSSGVTTTICVAAGQGSNVYAPDGSYSATIIGTATAAP